MAFGSVQVGNLGLLFMLLFFIYAALGVELFGKLGQSLRWEDASTHTNTHQMYIHKHTHTHTHTH